MPFGGSYAPPGSAYYTVRAHHSEHKMSHTNQGYKCRILPQCISAPDRLRRKIVIICFRHVGGNVADLAVWVYFSQDKIMELKILIFQQLEHMAILHGLVGVAE